MWGSVMRLESVKLEVVVFTQINFTESPKICTTHNETAFCLKTEIRSHLLKAQMLTKINKKEQKSVTQLEATGLH